MLPFRASSFAVLVVAFGSAGCAAEVRSAGSSGEDASLSPDDPAAIELGDESTEAPTADAPTENPAPGSDPTEPAASGCYGDFVAVDFAFPPDALSCNGPSYVRYDAEQGLWVGMVTCGDGFVRLYLAESSSGPFFPASDLAGQGQDHCELVAPGFTLGNEDDIASGNCSECSTGSPLSIALAPTFARYLLGEPFSFVLESTEWNYITSRLDCACDPSGAAPAEPPPPPPPPGDLGACFDDLVPSDFSFPLDDQSCDGPSFVRYSIEQGLWVGVVTCGDDSARLYLAASPAGPFLPALDYAGHGQDHCELVAPGFTLGNEDDIASGSCPACSAGPVQGVPGDPAYARAFAGEPFAYVDAALSTAYASRLTCCATP
jgi:hypothetical protein